MFVKCFSISRVVMTYNDHRAFPTTFDKSNNNARLPPPLMLPNHLSPLPPLLKVVRRVV